MNRSFKTRSMILTGIFTAIMIVMTAIPFLGYIPMGITRATLIHIPVIIGAIIMGPKYGAFLGFVFGCTSLWMSTFSPTLLSFAFSPFYSAPGVKGNGLSLVVCFVPRILTGVVAYYIWKLVRKIVHNKRGGEPAALIAAGLAGSLTNTLLVMNFIYFLFQDNYAAVKQVPISALYQVILGVIAANGIPEAVVAAAFTLIITRILLKFQV